MFLVTNRLPKCPCIDEGMSKPWYIHTLPSCSVIKGDTLDVCNNMDGFKNKYGDERKQTKTRVLTVWFHA